MNVSYLYLFVFSLSAIVAVTPHVALGAVKDETAMKNGIEAYNAGDFYSAISAFELASSTGYTHPSLMQNLGSAYYRVGQYDKAQEQFTRLSDFPAYAALAYYNLGLIANKQDNETMAGVWFRRVINNSADPTLTAMARRALTALGQSTRTEQTPRASGWLSVDTGYDSNVRALQDSLITANTNDTYTKISALTYGRVLGNQDNGVDLTLGLKALDYGHTTEYEYLRPIAEILGYKRFGSVEVSGLAGYDHYSTLKGNPYSDVSRAGFNAVMDVSRDATIGIYYVWTRIQMSNVADRIISGDMHQTRAEYNLWSRFGRSRLYYEHERNYRNNDPVNFHSYSPVRNTLYASHEYDFTSHWRAKLYVSERGSDYPNMGTNAATWYGHQDNRLLAGGELRWRYNSKFSVSGLYDYILNDSVADNAAVAASYRYSRYMIGLLASYQFDYLY